MTTIQIIYPINKTVFLIHKDYKKVKNRKITPCRVKTYERIGDDLITICKPIGGPNVQYDSRTYLIFRDIEKAVECLMDNKIKISVQ